MSCFYNIRAAAIVAALLVFTGCASAEKKKESVAQARGGDMRMAGLTAYSAGDYARAQTFFLESLRLDRSIDNRQAELVDLVNLARLSIAAGNYAGVRTWLADAVSLATAIGDENGLLEAYATLARVDYLSGSPDSALKHIDAALAIDTAHGVRNGARLNLRAQILVAAGDYEKAAPILKEALRLNLDAGDELETANSYRVFAEAGLAQGKDDMALEYYKKAYEAGREAGNSARLARDLLAISALEIRTGRRADAQFTLNRLYAVASASGMIEEASAALDRLIFINEAAGDAEQAAFYRNMLAELLKTKAGVTTKEGTR